MKLRRVRKQLGIRIVALAKRRFSFYRPSELEGNHKEEYFLGRFPVSCEEAAGNFNQQY